MARRSSSGARLFAFSVFNARASCCPYFAFCALIKQNTRLSPALKLAGATGCLFTCDFVLQDRLLVAHPSPDVPIPAPAQPRAPAVPVCDSVVYGQDDHSGCPVPEEAHGEEHDVVVVALIPHGTSPRLEQHDPDLGGGSSSLTWGKIDVLRLCTIFLPVLEAEPGYEIGA